MLQEHINYRDELAPLLWKKVEVHILYMVFLAQNWRIVSKENRYYSFQRLQREATLDELVDHWIDYGGLQCFWEKHHKVKKLLKESISEEGFMHFQVFFMLSHKDFYEFACKDLPDHSAQAMEWFFIKNDASQLRRRFAGIVQQ